MQELEVKLQESHNSESEFTREWLSLLEKKGYRSTKITDWSIWLKPFDWIIESDQDSYFFEAKKILWNIFKNSQMRQNQITSFLRITKLRNKPIGNCFLWIVYDFKQIKAFYRKAFILRI